MVNIKYVYLTKLNTFGVDMYGKKLKHIRQYLSLTQNEMANILSISNRTYASYEREENNPPYSMLVLLCTKYNINLNWFIADIGEMLNPPEFEDVKADILREVDDILIKYGVKNKLIL